MASSDPPGHILSHSIMNSRTHLRNAAELHTATAFFLFLRSAGVLLDKSDSAAVCVATALLGVSSFYMAYLGRRAALPSQLSTQSPAERAATYSRACIAWSAMLGMLGLLVALSAARHTRDYGRLALEGFCVALGTVSTAQGANACHSFRFLTLQLTSQKRSQ